MLHHIVDPNCFEQCLAQVRRAYWPLEEYLARQDALELPEQDHPDAVIREVGKRVEAVRAEVEKLPLYAVVSGPDQVSAHLPLPFIGRFHQLFLRRAWTEPYLDPKAHAQDLFRLARDPAGGNYSSQAGNYHHFVNVVAALARLVMYFQNHDNLQRLLEVRDPKFSAMHFADSPDRRSLLLMLAGFYHDIGKSVVDPRHAIEGSIILAHHTTSARIDLHRIAASYSPDNTLDPDDLQYVADLVYFHDHFGTLGTGEDSYLPLVGIIDRMKRYSLKHNSNKAHQLEWSRKYLFDLWALNVADIMVSVADKFSPQAAWLDADLAQDRIDRFFRSPKGGILVHDIKVALALIDEHCAKKHADDLGPLQTAAHIYSRRHVIERLRRLTVDSLAGPLARSVSSDVPDGLKGMATCIQGLSEDAWQSRIVRVIQSIGDYGDFCDRISWVGKMDYALGFFQRIASAALQAIEAERRGGPKSGWIRNPENALPAELRDRTQAEFFADNYVATLIQTLSYLLARRQTTQGPGNIEFNDAVRRLTDEKLAQLLTLEGPFRARKAVEGVLQTVYFY